VRCSVKYSVYQSPAPSTTEVLAAAAASDFPDSSCTQHVLTAAAASDCLGRTCSQQDHGFGQLGPLRVCGIAALNILENGDVLCCGHVVVDDQLYDCGIAEG
jgi:hypothetical protein